MTGILKFELTLSSVLLQELQVLVKSSSHREGLMREETERLKKAASEVLSAVKLY